jgi:hypothetical protein
MLFEEQNQVNFIMEVSSSKRLLNVFRKPSQFASIVLHKRLIGSKLRRKVWT